MSEIALRIGRPEDNDTAIALWMLADEARRGERMQADQVPRVRSYLSKPDAFLFIAEATGVAVGMALAMQGLFDDGAGPPIPGVCYLAMVYVAPEFWGRRIGGRLVDEMLAESRDRGYERILLWTQIDNPRAQRLYEGRGFRRTGREKLNDLGDHIASFEREL